MPQVLVKVTPDAFYYAFNHNARRRDQIRVSPILSEQVTIRCAQEFHRLNPAKKLGTPPDRKAHQAKIDRFHDKHCHIRLATDMDGGNKLGGFVVLSGELIGLHHIERGHGDWLMREAVSLGADRLDCYDIPHLIDLYERHGFREILREPNTTKGQPDVVWMRRS